ncbi:MAG: T9SS type A sorting domain-containing protein [Bacteroidota bacterium]
MKKLLTLSTAILLISTFSFTSAFANLELDNFQATKDGGFIVVSWNTLQEMNLNSFIVERSLDGDNWAFAGRVEQLPGNGAYYTFKDINIPDVNGIVYYRVHAFYTDDTFDTSEVIYIKGFDNVPDISINPNPVLSDVILNLTDGMNNEGLIEVFNSAGMLMMQESIPAGLMEYSFDVHALAPGFYVLKVQSGNDIKTQKFIKR